MTTGDPSKWVFYLLETAIPTNEWGHGGELGTNMQNSFRAESELAQEQGSVC